MNYFDRVKRVLESYKTIGEQLLDDGTLLIGRVPHIAPYAWLHSIYPVLELSEVDAIEKELRVFVPNSYKQFLLLYSNGLYMFSGSISLDGIRKKSGRAIENAYQPYSIFIPNGIERLRDAKPNHFFIGGYTSGNGSLLYIDTHSENVYRCSRKSVKPLNVWDSFEQMLTSETERLASLFDKKGVLKHPKKATTPPEVGK